MSKVAEYYERMMEELAEDPSWQFMCEEDYRKAMEEDFGYEEQ